ncbi:eclosion hormone [Hyalella azteca]|uniref:Eclosion hormone n=1 Tax=Hyalella azteca TaxID=294128 RepID=A0A8B7NVZ0_HYAAZ|nr:eclosion hormone [Hyalella azteca]
MASSSSLSSSKNLNVRVVVVLTVMLMLAVQATSAQGRSMTGLCIRNCGYCKEMYGDYFHGGDCAETCILTKGSSIPDCNRPSTFHRFIRRFQFSP